MTIFKNEAHGHSIEQIRNIGIIAHIDAGKTTVTERILFDTGRIHRVGETHDGKSQMDWMEQERERGITITSAATTTFWQDCRINIIDTPGHVDFTAEVVRSLRVLDGAITVLDAQAGVEPQTHSVWRLATAFGVPSLIFINKMDKTGADFLYSLNSLRERLHANAHPIQLPIGSEQEFCGIIDLIAMKARLYDEDSPEQTVRIADIPPDYAEEAAFWRQKLLVALAESDDLFLERYFSDQAPSEDEIRQALRRQATRAALFPVLCGAAAKNRGIRPLLDAVVAYLPSPLDIPPISGSDRQGQLAERRADPQEPFAALVFKIMSDAAFGRLTFFRVYSGQLQANSDVYNANTGKKERIGRILQVHANERQAVDQVSAGDIAAYVGRRDTVTGHTLCDDAQPIVLEAMAFPDPVIQVAVEPKSTPDIEKLAKALQRMTEEDPTMQVSTRAETGETILAGMGELHIEIILERIRREFNVEANIGKLQVAYRETFSQAVQGEGRYVHQAGGSGQYGHVVIEFTPLARGGGFLFENAVGADVIPPQFMNAIRSGLEDAMAQGVLIFFPFVDIKARVVGGSFHSVDSSKVAYQIAASQALKDAAAKLRPSILEPVMKAAIAVPQNFVGEIMRQISTRRGQILGSQFRSEEQIISALVPFAEMFGYATEMRSVTRGYGNFSMEFSHYQELPEPLQQQLIDSYSYRNFRYGGL